MTRGTSSIEMEAGADVPASPAQAGSDEIVEPSTFLLRWFGWYSRRYLRRHFHSLRVSCSGFPKWNRDLPLVLYSNHASWWDPMVGLFLNEEFFKEHVGFGPMDAEALKRYPMFRKMGFFPVERTERRGAVQFMRASRAVLSRNNGLLFVTPQGRFADPRERPIVFEPGMGHLACRAEEATFLPVAIEYVFWEERLPEILVRFGQADSVGNTGHRSGAGEWTRLFEERMQSNQDVLATEARLRDVEKFKTLLRGGSGQGGVYDLWRAAVARSRSEPHRKEHGVL